MGVGTYGTTLYEYGYMTVPPSGTGTMYSNLLPPVREGVSDYTRTSLRWTPVNSATTDARALQYRGAQAHCPGPCSTLKRASGHIRTGRKLCHGATSPRTQRPDTCGAAGTWQRRSPTLIAVAYE